MWTKKSTRTAGRSRTTSCVDPHDDYLVALAREARADVIVSGDAHLTKLELDPPVLTPREFLDWLNDPSNLPPPVDDPGLRPTSEIRDELREDRL